MGGGGSWGNQGNLFRGGRRGTMASRDQKVYHDLQKRPSQSLRVTSGAGDRNNGGKEERSSRDWGGKV